MQTCPLPFVSEIILKKYMKWENRKDTPELKQVTQIVFS